MSAVEPALGYGEAVLYGIVQGLTEFLPVSSSGHLQIAHLLGVGALPQAVEQPFDVLLHAGTLVAIVTAFWREILRVFASPPRVWACLLVSMVPTGIAGFFFASYLDLLRSWWALGASFSVTALLLVAAHGLERRAHPEDHGAAPITDLTAVRPGQAALVGALQVFALLPGVSRSGSTIAAGLIAGMGPQLAVAWSFLVGLPLIGAAATLKAFDGGIMALLHATGPGPLIVGFLASLLSGILAIVLLRLVVRRRGLPWFAGYTGVIALCCFAAAIFVR